MSPEQVEGRIEAICPASDIYSLGATLYVLLAGRRPHRAGPFEMLRQIPQDKPVPPRRLVPGRAQRPGGDLPEGDGEAS